MNSSSIISIQDFVADILTGIQPKIRVGKMTEVEMVEITVLKDLIANRLAIIVENPGAKQLWAMKPSFNSAKQITSSPCFQSQEGMLSKYAWNHPNKC